MNDLLWLMASKWMIKDKRLISFGRWHPKWMVGVSEQLTLANDALRG